MYVYFRFEATNDLMDLVKRMVDNKMSIKNMRCKYADCAEVKVKDITEARKMYDLISELEDGIVMQQSFILKDKKLVKYSGARFYHRTYEDVFCS